MADYTIDQWCKKRQVCRATFYNLQKVRKAPDTYRIGSRQRITEAADAIWEEKQQAEAARSSEAA